jgi:hypothetical protein
VDLDGEEIKEENFKEVFAMLRELEGNDAAIIESLY